MSLSCPPQLLARGARIRPLAPIQEAEGELYWAVISHGKMRLRTTKNDGSELIGLLLSPCLNTVFTFNPDIPFAERVSRLGKIGYRAYEFWSWHGIEAELERLREAQEEAGLRPSCLLTASGELLMDPGNRARFVEELKRSIAVARGLDCPTLLVTAGAERAGAARGPLLRSIATVLKAGAPYAEEAGIVLVLEPVNALIDHPGTFLSLSAEAFAIVDEVGSPNVKVLYDIYHQQITEGNLVPTIVANIARIGHFHAADHPGRAGFGHGEIAYRFVMEAINRAGYTGNFGLEYIPKAGVTAAEADLARILADYRMYETR